MSKGYGAKEAEFFDGVIKPKWERMQKAALNHVRRQQTSVDGDRPWDERTVRDMYNVKVLEAMSGERRAKINANAAPRVFGVVVVPGAVESKEAWEREIKAIEAEEVPRGLPEKAVLSGPRVEKLPGQLAENLPPASARARAEGTGDGE